MLITIQKMIDTAIDMSEMLDKINIDMGTYNTKACCLLILDTFEYHIFQLKD